MLVSLNVPSGLLLLLAGLHGDEWTSVSSTLYVMRRALTDEKYVNGMHMFFLPVANPDGYVFTRSDVCNSSK